MATSTQRAYLASRQFSQECYRASRALRRAPAEVKRDTKAAVRTEVAEPLARKIASAASGPYGSVLGPAVKTTADLTPRIKIGGARKVVSGGANVKQLVYGTEWGGGKRTTIVNRERVNKRKRRGRVSAAEKARQAATGKTQYRRKSTMQFRTPRPFIYSTIRRERAAMLDAYGEVVMKALRQVIDRG